MSDRPARPMLHPTFREGFRRRAITAAMAELCVAQGYLRTSVRDLAAGAHMSRGTIHVLYGNREEVFLDLLDRIAADLLALAEEACRRAGADPRDRIEAGLRAILDWTAEEPARAYTFLIQAPYATPGSDRRYQAAISGLAALLGAAVGDGDGRTPRAEEIMVGGLAAVLARRAREGRLEGAPALLKDFVGLVTTTCLR